MPRKKWEHTIRCVSVDGGPALQQLLDEMDAEGWRLVAWPETTEGPGRQAWVFERGMSAGPEAQNNDAFIEPAVRHVQLPEDADASGDLGKRRINFDD